MCLLSLQIPCHCTYYTRVLHFSFTFHLHTVAFLGNLGSRSNLDLQVCFVTFCAPGSSLVVIRTFAYCVVCSGVIEIPVIPLSLFRASNCTILTRHSPCITCTQVRYRDESRSDCNPVRFRKFHLINQNFLFSFSYRKLAQLLGSKVYDIVLP